MLGSISAVHAYPIFVIKPDHADQKNKINFVTSNRSNHLVEDAQQRANLCLLIMLIECLALKTKCIEFNPFKV